MALEARPEREALLFRGPHVLAQALERLHVGVERGFGRDNGLAQLLAPRLGARELVAAAGEPQLELPAGVFEPSDVGEERRRALRQSGVGGLGLGGAPGLGLHRLARLEEPALRLIQAVVRSTLLFLDSDDRGARFFLARFLRPQLLCSGPALDRDLVLLAVQPLDRLAPGPRLQLEHDDVLLLAMELALNRRDRGFDSGDRGVELDEHGAQPIDRAPLRLETLAQFLDLALGGEDA